MCHYFKNSAPLNKNLQITKKGRGRYGKKYIILKNHTTTLYFLKVILEGKTTDFCDYGVVRLQY